jgi:hypothetical protein
MKFKPLLVILLLLLSSFPSGLFKPVQAAQTNGDDFEDGTLDFWTQGYGGNPTYYGNLGGITNDSYAGDWAVEMAWNSTGGCRIYHDISISDSITLQFWYKTSYLEEERYPYVRIVSLDSSSGDNINLVWWWNRFFLYVGSNGAVSSQSYEAINTWRNITITAEKYGGVLGVHLFVDGVFETGLPGVGSGVFSQISLWGSVWGVSYGYHTEVFDDVFWGPSDEEIPLENVDMPPYVYAVETWNGEEEYVGQLWFSAGTDHTYLIHQTSENWRLIGLMAAPHRSLGVDSGGNLHVVWDEFNDYCYYANSTDGGVTWSTPILIEVDGSNFYPLDMAVDMFGYIHIIGTEMGGDYLTYVRLDNVTRAIFYSINGEIPQGVYADLCVDALGNAHIIYASPPLSIHYINYTISGWGNSIEISGDDIRSDFICIEQLENGSFAVEYQEYNTYDYHAWFGDWSGFGDESTFGAGTETENFNPGHTDGSNQVRDLNWRSQTFTTGSNPIIVSEVYLWMYKGSGTPQTVTVGIRETSGGKPTGGDLAYGTRDPTGFLVSPGQMEYFTLNTLILLEANTMYALVCRSPTSDSSNWSGIRFEVHVGYSGGTIVDSSDGGSSWTINTGADYNFALSYGYVNYYNCFSMITEGNTVLSSYYAEVGSPSGSDDLFYYVTCTAAGGYGSPEAVANATALADDGYFSSYRFDLAYNFTATKPEMVFLLDPDDGNFLHYKAQRNSWEIAGPSLITEDTSRLSALWSPFGYEPNQPEEPEEPPAIEDYGIANMEGCGNWVFEGNTKYLFYATASAGNTSDLQLGLGFYDTANRWYSMLYNTETTAFTKNTPNDAVSIALQSVSLVNTSAYVAWHIMFHNEIADSLNVTLYTFIGSSSDLVVWNATAPNYFNIYNIGGYANYQKSGDAGRTTGGDAFELWAEDAPSWSYCDLTYKYLQHIHFLFSWDTGDVAYIWPASPSYLICPSIDHQYDGTVEFGIYVCHGDTWIQELSVRLDINNGDVDDHKTSPNTSWVRVRVRWYHLGDLIKTDYLYTYHNGIHPIQDQTFMEDTSMKFWVDLWFNKVNASTTMGGRVNAYQAGMGSGGWWLWSDYYPIYGNFTQSMCFTTIHDTEDNVISAKELKMMKVYANVTKLDCDDLWKLRDYDIFAFTFAHASMEGIDTPSSEFQPTQDPTLPMGGLLGGLSGVFQTLAKNIAYSLTFGALAFAGAFANSIDFLGGLFGVTNFTDMLLGAITGMTAYVALASQWITTLYSYVFGFLTGFFYWLWAALDATLGRWQQMWALLGSILSGTYTGTVGLWDYFQLGSFLMLFIVFIPVIYFEGLVKSRSPLRTLWGDFQSVVDFFSTVLGFLSSMVSAVIDAIHAAIEAIPVVE